MKHVLLSTACSTLPALETFLQKEIATADRYLDTAIWAVPEMYVLITQDGTQVQGDCEGLTVMVPTTGTMDGAICRVEELARQRCAEWNSQHDAPKLHVDHYRDALRRAQLSWKLLLADVQREREELTKATVTTPSLK